MTVSPVPSPAAKPARVRVPAHTGWQLTASAGPVPRDLGRLSAEIPGCVHTDLLAAGVIPDPYLDDNEAATAWVGLTDWTYATTLPTPPAPAPGPSDGSGTDDDWHHDLVFEGVDTVATIALDGQVVGQVQNMHRTHRFDITGSLGRGPGRLEVAFASPLKQADARSVELGWRPSAYPDPFNALRKMAASFGWDWGIRTLTSGLHRPVYLDSWRVARIGSWRPQAIPLADGAARLRVPFQIVRAETHPGAHLTLTLTLGDTSASLVLDGSQSDGVLELQLPEVERWWPAGYGTPRLYEAQLALHDASGEALDQQAKRVGFRTVELDTTPDAAGTPFTLRVNGQDIFVRGVNWIPDDAFVSRVGPARYRERLTQARSAHINLVRVWGGGLYEDEAFYDVCDELGLLVWQDLAFACAAYSEDEPLRGEIEAEVRDNVERLAHRASLALLNGNNENLWGYLDWNWRQLLDGKSWGEWYYRELFPAIVAELAPLVPYTPGSPYSPGEHHPNAEAHGSMHLWEQWNRLDWRTYRDHAPRFVAEFGWQGPPAWRTLIDAISDDPLTPQSPYLQVHQKAAGGADKLTGGLMPHLALPEEIDDWHWAMQLNQAHAIEFALEHFRALAPHCAGAIVWQLNDTWPSVSWAAIDWAGREKPLYFALRHAFADRLVTIQPGPDADRLVAHVINDSATPWAAQLTARRVSLDGAELARFEASLDLGPRDHARIELPAHLATAQRPAGEALVADCDETRGWWWFAEPRDMDLRASDLEASATAIEGGYRVTLHPRRLVRDVSVLADKVHPEARARDALVTLAAGERAHIDIEAPAGLDPEAFLAPEVLRHTGQLVRPE